MAHKKRPTKISKTKGPQYIVVDEDSRDVVTEDGRLVLFDSEQAAIDYVTDDADDTEQAEFEVVVLEVVKRSLWEISPEKSYYATKKKVL